ncbi:MAG: biopolymer transporter ExbD [Thermoanaerobaculia bacterium]|jgi:biopolymer transport protein ExbD
MATSIPSGGPRSVQSEINITPLVDVVLVLLIIFMVAQPILQMGLDVEVPPKVEVTAPPPENSMPQLVINVKKTGFFLNADKLADYDATDLSKLREAIAKQCHPSVRPDPNDRVVFINAEDTVPFDFAVRAMDAAHAAGAKKIGFLTDTK